MGMRPPALTVVVPSYNERDNVSLVVQRLSKALHDIPFEIIFVDDLSPDGTADAVREAASADPRLRLISRCSRGLSGAALEGMLSAHAPLVAVIDCDLQHDETLLPQMKAALEAENADLVVASRYVAGGSGAALAGSRQLMSVWGGK